MSNLAQRELFGGAITADFPTDLIDASQLRQIPDTQEVLLSTVSDDSIVLEILQRVPPVDFTEAAKFHFSSIAQDNEAISSSVEEVLTVPNDRGDLTPSVVILYGRQGVQKFNRTHVDDVRVLLALYRVEDKSVDLVLTLNFPMNVGNGVVRSEDQYHEAKRAFQAIATSLRIIDFSLFA
ncbi:Mog1p/PsbP-like protein [Gloeopeniophorella convolvens]|nr:Mog1p/PsbP-like protein [Gloeopeniophorella convolvens]